MDLYIAALIFSISIILLAKYKTKFIYIYIVLNVSMDVIIGFIDIDTAAMALVRAIIALLYIGMVFKESRGKMFSSSYIILVFYLYTLCLTLFSSNILLSISFYMKVLITITMFPVGAYYFDSINKLQKLNIATIWIMALVTINFIFTNIYGIGINPYGDSVDFYVGNLKLSAINTPVYSLLIIYSIIQFNKRQHIRYAIIMAIPTFIFLLLSMKRISLVALGAGFLIILYYSKAKLKYITMLVTLVVIVLMISPFYSKILDQQLKVRGDKLNVRIIEEESRYSETFLVWEKIILDKKPLQTLFGIEIYNSIGYYADARSGRPLHVDYNVILFGSGIIGLFLYIMIYVNIYNRFPTQKMMTGGNHNSMITLPQYSSLKTIFMSIILVSMIISLSGGMMGISHRTIAFLYLGACVGLTRKKRI